MDSLDEQLAALKMMNSASSVAGQSPGKKVGPAVPPKPKKTLPQVPKSCTVKAAREPSYSMLLQGSGGSGNTEPVPLYSNLSQLQQGPKHLADNAILHGNHMNGSHTYSNVHLHGDPRTDRPMTSLGSDGLVYSNIIHRTPRDISTYSNIQTCNGFGTNGDELPPPPLDLQTVNSSEYVQCNVSGSNCFPPPPPLPDDDLPLPPSPVSSSYSELQRATDTPYQQGYQQQQYQPQEYQQQGFQQTFPQEYGNYDPSFQSSSTYESIYEAINPRPPSQMSSRSNYSLYAPYVSGSQSQVQQGSALLPSPAKEAEVDALTSLLVQSLDGSQDSDIYGICVKCGERILGESSGCTAMEQVYHITCFTCCHCAINLQGKPFYALEDKPYCEEDYLNTLEKCSVCMKPILDRILRATGKPYHPACFSCIVCGKSLDGIPFTVDATNQIHCIEDFHRKFAPRCCVCKLPIMPEAGQDETVRVVALDRSFHISCYKCEDCGLLLSSEAEGRGCYPLDDHVLCKSCNAERVQALTTHMTTEL